MFLNFIFACLIILPQDTVYFKTDQDFKVEIDIKYKGRIQSPNSFAYNNNVSNDRTTRSGLLPYLKFKITVVKTGENEQRVKVLNDNDASIYKGKIESGSQFDIDVGYLDDIKKIGSPVNYFIYFLSAKKKSLSLVHIRILHDGTFLVNNSVRGKF